MYLKYFESNGHVSYPSDSLIPSNDPTLLFTGAGMNQFKDMFIGVGNLGFKRATTCQKCLRTGDIENVGKTSSHHTFFEMLGNFSFGDYFKNEVIEWAWEFVRKKANLKEEKLSVSVYQDDDEAYNIWNKKMGVPAGKIYKFGEDDNFWPAGAPSKGPNGPCGPCTEIFYDQGANIGCGSNDCNPSCDCDRYVEIWNLVLMQFERSGDGKMDPLKNKCIDTGMGLERIARVMQGVYTNFDIDSFVPIINNISELVGVEYDSKQKSSSLIRRIADHVRAIVFCIADGVYFSNEGRGYVERRLLRRAMRDVMELGKNEVLLYKLVPVIADVMLEPYPAIKERRENIARVVKSEEERFHETLEKGTVLLDESIEKLKKSGGTVFSGADSFRLYDTFGFPVDMTESILEENGLTLDMAGFESEMEKQREQARAGTRIKDSVFSGAINESDRVIEKTVFKGYELDKAECKVRRIINKGDDVEFVEAGKGVFVDLDVTPFYAEAGGQVGDKGTLVNDNCHIDVINTIKENNEILHICKIEKGRVGVGDVLNAEVDVDRRAAIKRNHSATHILHHILRQILGEHAEQAGSNVDPDRLRFDFRHFTSVTKSELERIEFLVNEHILKDGEVATNEMGFKEAIDSGVTALFGEKYGERVRAVSIGDYSKELCGGTHVSRTGNIGLFKIISESSIAAGVRRIEAITGIESLKKTKKKDELILELCEKLNTSEDLLKGRVADMLQEIKGLGNEIHNLKQASQGEIAGKLLDESVETAGVKVIARKLDGASIDDLRNTADSLRKSSNSAAIALGSVNSGNVALIVALTDDVVKRGLNAGKIIKDIAKIVGGGGGGKPDMAQAGGKLPEKLDEAISRALQIFKENIESS